MLEGAVPITLQTCRPPPSTEPPFQILKSALAHSATCRAMAAEVEGRGGGGGAQGGGSALAAAGLSSRLREVWNASRQKW